MKKSPNHSSERTPQQPMLPTSVRCAIGTAMLTVLPACQSTSTIQTDIQSPVIVDVSVKPEPESEPEPTDTQEVVAECKDVTPQCAVSDALADPLKLVTQLDDHIYSDGSSKSCIWQNEFVKIVSYGCPHAKSKLYPDRSREHQIMFRIHYPSGNIFDIYINTKTHKSVFDVNHSGYNYFYVSLSKTQNTQPIYQHNMPLDDFLKLQDIIGDHDDKVPHIFFSNAGGFDTKGVDPNTVDRKAFEEFVTKPDETWYRFMQQFKSLYTRHGFRRAD